jgi:hypothetical protein
MSAKESLTHCPTSGSNADGRSAAGSIGATSFPSYGDHRAAYNPAETINGVPIGLGTVVSRTGQVVVLLGLRMLGALNPQALERATALTLHRVTTRLASA